MGPLGEVGGDVPFYMRHGGGEYVDTGGSSFRLGDNARRWKGGCVVSFAAAGVITGGITRDQCARREDDRKGRMDPMSSFVVGSSPSHPPPVRNIGIADDEVVVATRRTRRRDDDDDGDADEDRRRRRREEESRMSRCGGRSSDERRGRRKCEGNVRGNTDAAGRILLATAAPTATEAMPMMAEGFNRMWMIWKS
ncbi:hypothetical protein ACHAW5_010168 [Stephanodiscus triporus]|uniref:Uncharacterized protein n=1 Tax=Stephanodiscus triporus TaxID=2934178 RepID=A0ABD3QXW5_9STRA